MMPEKIWDKAFVNMRKSGFFKNFLKKLDTASDTLRSENEWKRFIQYTTLKYPWAMESYRKYHTRYLLQRTNSVVRSDLLS